LNATLVEPGGAIGAQVTVVNTLNKNLSLAASYPANSTISTWNRYDFICGNSGSLLRSMLGFALFSGYYSAGNISLASSPLQLAPQVAVGCVGEAAPDSVVFLPNNDTAVLYARAYPGGTPEQVRLVASTGSCAFKSQGSLSCGAGRGLLGYWNSSGIDINTLGDQNGTTILSKYFRYFSPGAYTLVAEDIWNQTVYAHFEVVPAFGHPVVVVSVAGPIPPYNPGGPVVGITVMNTGDIPVISLNTTLSVPGTNTPYSFVFGVNSTNPLLRGQSISAARTLIGAGFDTSKDYSLTVNGVLANGVPFSYAEETLIVAAG
jgi:hypothetical protein